MGRFKRLAMFGAAAAVLLGATSAFAADAADAMFTVNNVWMMVATFLVFIMHLGFATIESGLTRSKNTVNVLFKNTLIPAIGLLTFAFCGFNLMYPATAGSWASSSGLPDSASRLLKEPRG